MADAYISDLTAQTTPSSADLVEIEQVSDSTSKKSTLAQVIGTVVVAASTTVAGTSELAIASEVNTGTSVILAVTPDALAGSNLGIRLVSFALNGSVALTTSDAVYFRIPAALNGMNLVSATASVGTGSAGSSSSGLPQFAIWNVTDGHEMCSVDLTVDAGEYSSATATTPVTIDAGEDDVVTDDLIRVTAAVTGAGTTYAVVTLGFALP